MDGKGAGYAVRSDDNTIVSISKWNKEEKKEILQSRIHSAGSPFVR